MMLLFGASKGMFELTAKGKRKGVELAWADLVSGQAALAAALNASLVQLTISAIYVAAFHWLTR